MRAESFETKNTIFLNLCGPFMFISIVRSRLVGYRLNAPDIKIEEYYFSFLGSLKVQKYLRISTQIKVLSLRKMILYASRLNFLL